MSSCNRPLRLLALLALATATPVATADDAAPSAPAASTPPAAASAVDAEEYARFRETLSRYEERMAQFDGDARDYLQAVEADARSVATAEYGEQISQLDDSQDELRASAIQRFEAFLRKYPTGENSAHAMFRLGDLYYEKTEADFLVAEREFGRLMEGFDFDNATVIPESPVKDYSRSMGLYRRIIDEHPEYRFIDGAYYMLGFCLARDGSAQFDEEESREVFQALVDRYPDSQFAVAAHLRLGEYYFDYNQTEQAIPHYQEVIRLAGPEGDLYDEGLYKLAWSYYKLSDYDRALELFTQLLDWSKASFAKRGFESATAPEAVEYTAISFSDISDKTGVTPLDAAKAFYGRVGTREFEKDVYVRLASVLTDQARFEDSIQVYQFLQQRWPEDPENPTHQWRIAQIAYVMDEPDRAQQAIAELTERYNDESAWWTANRNDPDAQTVARSYIEKSLAAVATGYHNQGLETGDKEAFARAAELYGQYLRKFPFAADYYEIQWYRADTLMQTEQYDAAETEFIQLLKATDHPYRDGSLWNLMQVRKGRLERRYPSFDARPADAVEDRRVTLQNGNERVIWKLSEDHLAFIEAANALLDANVTEPDYREALDNNRVPLKYIIAQIYYHHGMFDEARPRLQDLIDQHPEWDEAAFSASMMINSYQDEGNLQKVQMLAVEYAGRPLGGGVKKRDEFANLAEQASFKLAEQLIGSDRIAAARAFEQFMKDYPKSKYVTDAHYNAANSYEVAGRVDDANRLFKQYIDNIEAGRYKQDDRSRALYFRIASNYAEVLDLENAIRYYEALYQRFPDYQDSAAAVYNAAFLRIGLADHRGAAENFERYSRLSPTPADAEQVLFAAGDQWERVDKAQAIEFYRRYIARYPDASPDRVMEARYRIAELTAETQGERQVDRAWEELGENFARLAPSGKVGPRGRHYAAQAEVRKLQERYEAFEQIEFSKNEEKNVKLLLETKVAELAAIEEHATRLVNTYADFDGSAAALYFVGRAYLRYSDMLYEAPPPRGLDQEGLDIYNEEIDKRRIPVEDKGRARLEANLQKARDAKQWNEWVTRTVDLLADRFPSDFAKEKQELRGTSDSAFVPRGAPMGFRPKARPEAQAPAGEGGEQ
ncbi:tetratricopeptide repeat protein [Myxococcota bacterium]|nr:tetratricopeptide repeat protein [Myxococcota bacterium]